MRSAQLYSYWIVKNYREAYNIFACNGILFNHTSPRRGETFILRKITMGVAKITHGIEDTLVSGFFLHRVQAVHQSRKLSVWPKSAIRFTRVLQVLGNLNAQRDLGHARDYVEGMWRMLQQDTADDYVLATGQMFSVRTLVEKAFATQGIQIQWTGDGVEEKGLCALYFPDLCNRIVATFRR